MSGESRLLRGRSEADGRVGSVELFFDLVFVFAVTQLSHYLLAHQTLAGAGQAAMLFVAIWWTWIYTIWCTNWLDTDAPPVRLLLFGLMAGGLFLSMAIPTGFAGGRLVFAIAFAACHVLRPLFMLVALRNDDPGHFRNFQRIAIWGAMSGALWIAGGVSPATLTPFWWLAALVVDCLGPPLRFRLPVLGASSLDDWDVEAHHLSERCGLFVIIALGESLLLTGATFGQQQWSWPGSIAFAAAFMGAVAMWWIYFHIGAEEATHRFADSDDRGKVARFAYTYLHILIIAGIIVTAAGDEMLIAHAEHLTIPALLLVVGGPLLFVSGTLAFKKATAPGPRLSHVVGIAALLVLGVAAFVSHGIDPAVLGIATSAILVTIALWETLSLGGARTV